MSLPLQLEQSEGVAWDTTDASVEAFLWDRNDLETPAPALLVAEITDDGLVTLSLTKEDTLALYRKAEWSFSVYVTLSTAERYLVLRGRLAVTEESNG